ncbi:pleckstrin homology domain-containing family O member 2 isoform X2 [Sardina pilchardus]|uniref:pleckstrin homology domain-containing family O member 2 isoform X2 n=1 Tax=Sardina pilchardus TaxID=27697 RepID=UPI002E116A1F
MEDGGKEDTGKPKEVKLTGKAGWLKKSSGGFFGSYKDRYLQLEHTEIGVYENEDLKNCLERLDLENYEKCHELRGAFKKKNRLILIKAPKCVNKVHDVKLQAQNQEDKEAWIKALSDGINRAKNKIFDEVKVDEGSSLEHVTRTRPKGNRGRRPPTRIHMKEVANVSSDGILRLDLDVTDNGIHINTEEGTQSDRVTTTTSDGPKDEPTSEEPTPQKKILKPPMPPSKQIKPVAVSEEDNHGETTSDSGVDTGAPPTPSKPSSSQDDLSSDSSSVDKDPKPPKPPSKEKKPTLGEEKEEEKEEEEEEEEEEKEEKEAKVTPEAESEVKDKEETEEKTEETTEAAQNNEQDKPTDTDDLPPKMVLKPSVVMWDTPLADTSTEAEQADVSKEAQSTPEPLKKAAAPTDVSKETQSTPEPLKKTTDPPDVSKETKSTPEPLKKAAAPTDVSKETQSTPEPLKKTTDPPDVSKETKSTPEPVKKAVGPPAPPKKKPVKCPVKSEDSKQPSDAKKDKGEEKESSSSELISESAKTLSEAQPETNTLSKSPEPSTESEVVPSVSVSEEKVEPCDVSVGKVEQEEEKSVDSGQHSAEESENGDTAATTPSAALPGSQAKLDEDSSEADETEPSNAQSENTREGPPTGAETPSASHEEPCGFDSPALPPSLRNRPQILSPRPIVPLKPSVKVRSASVGDLLAEPPQQKQETERGKESAKSAERDMKDLESKMTLEIKNTGDLLHTVSDQQKVDGGNQGELSPEVLLATAMEKLRKAEEILSVAKSFKGRKGSENKRVSW